MRQTSFPLHGGSIAPTAAAIDLPADEHTARTTDGNQFFRQPQIDRSGTAIYLHLIRAADDPERPPRKRGANRDAAPHLTIRRTTTVDDWRHAILQHLDDDVPRTFNRLGVELRGLTADILFSGPADTALWELVADGLIELTLEAPILFRRAR